MPACFLPLLRTRSKFSLFQKMRCHPALTREGSKQKFNFERMQDKEISLWGDWPMVSTFLQELSSLRHIYNWFKRAVNARAFQKQWIDSLTVTVWTRWQAEGKISSSVPLWLPPGEVGVALFVGEALSGRLGWENTASHLGLEKGEGKPTGLGYSRGAEFLGTLLAVQEINQGLDFVMLAQETDAVKCVFLS